MLLRSFTDHYICLGVHTAKKLSACALLCQARLASKLLFVATIVASIIYTCTVTVGFDKCAFSKSNPVATGNDLDESSRATSDGWRAERICMHVP